MKLMILMIASVSSVVCAMENKSNSQALLIVKPIVDSLVSHAVQNSQNRCGSLKSDLSSLSNNHLLELNDLINNAGNALHTLSYETCKRELSFVEKSISKPLFIDYKKSARDIQENVCLMRELHKNIKKLEKKEPQKKAKIIIDNKIKLINHTALMLDKVKQMAEHRKLILTNAEGASSESAAAASIGNSQELFKKNSHVVLEHITYLKNKSMSNETLDDMREFITSMVNTYALESNLKDIIDDLFEPALLACNVAKALTSKAKPTEEYIAKVENCLQIQAMNYRKILLIIEESIEQKIKEIS